MSYEEERNLVKRNENGNLYGEVECQICKKIYKWEENINADAIVEKISAVENRGYVVLDIISKCPNCNYKIKHCHNERNDNV